VQIHTTDDRQAQPLGLGPQSITRRPNATTVTYTNADNEVGWADKNDKMVRGHNLVWKGVPTWIAVGELIEFLHRS
jgi:GH35 family endo-1,4-beta-xylanase